MLLYLFPFPKDRPSDDNRGAKTGERGMECERSVTKCSNLGNACGGHLPSLTCDVVILGPSVLRAVSFSVELSLASVRLKRPATRCECVSTLPSPRNNAAEELPHVRNRHLFHLFPPNEASRSLKIFFRENSKRKRNEDLEALNFHALDTFVIDTVGSVVLPPFR